MVSYGRRNVRYKNKMFNLSAFVMMVQYGICLILDVIDLCLEYEFIQYSCFIKEANLSQESEYDLQDFQSRSTAAKIFI